jgi:beta-amylase
MSIHVNVMAPLVIGDPADLNGEKSRAAWEKFRTNLQAMKCAGVYAIFFDVWWGLVEKQERQYDWRYYDKLVACIEEAQLKAVPNISLHQCGGNIGDDFYQPLPAYIWPKLAAKVPSGNIDAAKYVSEQGHASVEFVSCWAVDLVVEDDKAFFVEFQRHFADKAHLFVEVTISLGPAGELRYPSYNSHDSGAGFPSRGSLQCYSELARKSWEAWVLRKYRDREGVRQAWGELVNIEPPTNPDAFFHNRTHINTQYGRDLFDWYQQSLLYAANVEMNAALDVFGVEGAPFNGINVGAKVPGVHWRMGHWDGDKLVLGDRLAEITAGMIRTSDADIWGSETAGRGYRPIVSFFKRLQTGRTARIIMHCTCLEKADGEDANMGAQSLAATLVQWVGAEAERQQVSIKGENALGWNLPKRKSWRMMRNALRMPGATGAYEGLTLLRITDLVNSDVAMTKLKALCTCLARINKQAEQPAASKKNASEQAA